MILFIQTVYLQIDIFVIYLEATFSFAHGIYDAISTSDTA